MTEKEKNKNNGGISRRQFLKDAGIVVGSTAVGSAFFLSACGQEVEVTKTVTTTAPGTTSTVTTTVPGSTVTTTQAQTETIIKYTCPCCSQEFDTLSTLKSHFDADHDEATNLGVLMLNVNGVEYKAIGVRDCDSLLDVLRDKLALTGAKKACDVGSCGACTVLVDGKPTLACMTLAATMVGKNILTIEGLANGSTLDPVQEAFIEKRGAACGFCTPGMILTTKALLEKNPTPTLPEIKEALGGNICICGIY
jgi:carbon-monoxide dehydrogenase small subunit